MLDLTGIKYFTLNEILNASPTKKYQLSDIPEDIQWHLRTTLQVLDALRDYYGKRILLNCTFRDVEHNKEVGGALNSMHLVFNAIDWTVDNKADLPKLYEVLNHWDRTGYYKFLLHPSQMGLGYYFDHVKNIPRFIHLDTRGYIGRLAPSRWDG